MTPEQTLLYDQIKKSDDIIVDVEDQTLLIQNVLTLITRLQQISTDPSLLGFGAGSGKLLWLEEFFDDHPNEHVVVFTRFRDVALSLARKYRAPHIVGGSTSESFSEDTFQRLFGTIDAMGEGLNLQRATTAIFLDAHWSTTKMTQAYDRIHRLGISSPRNVYLLNSCREDIIVYKAISKKWSVHDLVYQYLEV
jgi:SNF2 family DNA or RNA helicase